MITGYALSHRTRAHGGHSLTVRRTDEYTDVEYDADDVNDALRIARLDRELRQLDTMTWWTDPRRRELAARRVG